MSDIFHILQSGTVISFAKAKWSSHLGSDMDSFHPVYLRNPKCEILSNRSWKSPLPPPKPWTVAPIVLCLQERAGLVWSVVTRGPPDRLKLHSSFCKNPFLELFFEAAASSENNDSTSINIYPILTFFKKHQQQICLEQFAISLEIYYKFILPSC